MKRVRTRLRSRPPVLVRLLWLPAVVFAAPALVSGCTKTSDGSMVLSRSLIMPRLSRPQAVAAQSSFEAPPFVEQLQPGDPPVVKPKPKPVEARRVVPDVQLWKPAVVKPPFASTGPEHPLNCHNETSPTGRVRVICD